jgi:putative hydrolase of the HAD superfamily
MQIRAVLFDLGGTLVKTADVPQIFSRILETYGIKVSPSEVLEAHKANEKEFDVDVGQLELGEAFWSKWDLKILETLGITEKADSLAEKINESWWNYAELEFYPDVVKTLNQLKAMNVKTGIVTNGLKKDFEQILRKLNAMDRFDVIVGIDTCKRAKPDKEIFIYAVEKLQVKPEETIFIGDSLEKDYEGAKRAGLKPLLIDRENKSDGNFETITSLSEVLICLGKNE